MLVRPGGGAKGKKILCRYTGINQLLLLVFSFSLPFRFTALFSYCFAALLLYLLAVNVWLFRVCARVCVSIFILHGPHGKWLRVLSRWCVCADGTGRRHAYRLWVDTVAPCGKGNASN